MNGEKKAILYFERSYGLRKLVGDELAREFPGYQIILSNGEIREVKQILGDVKNIGVICVGDNALGGNRGEKIVESFRKKGYVGKIIYTGHRPAEKKFFDYRARKIGPGLISKIRHSLP